MFYYGEKPWHGNGTSVSEALNASEALKTAKLDFTVEKRDIFLKDNVHILGKYATVRTDENRVLGIVGKRYRVIQNSDMLSFFDPLIEKSEAIYHTAGVLGHGERIWLLAKLPDSMRIGNDDIIDKYILLTNSHDGSGSALVKITNVRVVCENTLNFSITDAGKMFRISHTSSYQEKLDKAYQILGIAQNYFKTVEQTINKLSIQEMTDKQLLEYVNSVLDIKSEEEISKQTKDRREKILELYETGKGSELAKGTLWGGLNAVTEYVDHHMKTRDNKYIDNVWFGTGNSLKNKAYNILTNVINQN